MDINGYEYREDELQKLTDRIADLIATEFDRTQGLGPIHHFMVFCNVYTSLLVFFFGQIADTDEDCDQLLDILHENDKEAKEILKEIKAKMRKLN